MGLRHRFPRRCSTCVKCATLAEEDGETRHSEVWELSKVTVILLLIGLPCFPIAFALQSYLSVSNTFLLFIFSFYVVPIYMVAAVKLLVLVIGDEARHKAFRACSD